MWGLDGSLTILFSPEWTFGLNYSYLGMTEFFNPITKNYDPINAPRHKAGLKINYKPRKHPFDLTIKARYVDGFKWSSVSYYGNIKTYTILDLHLGYELNKNIKMNLTVNNIFDNKHIEIIGGPSLGQIIMLRLETKL